MIAGLIAASALASSQVVVVEGGLAPGRVATLQIGESPRPSTTNQTSDPPALRDLRIDGAVVLRTTSARPGITNLEIVPRPTASEVRLELGGQRWAWPVVPDTPTPIAVPARATGTTQKDDQVSFTIRATETPTLTPADVAVYASEGQVTVAEGSRPDRLVVTLVPEERSAPRVVPVVIVDHRAPRRPKVVPVALKARPRLTVTATPGSDLSMSVGRRTYGPVTVPESGSVTMRVDQLAGETVAKVRATDDLGNATTSDLSLATTTQPMLVLAPAGPWRPSEPPPALYLWAWRPTGAPWPTSPVCQTPQAPLELSSPRAGQWSVELAGMGDAWRESRQDLRIACTVSEVSRSVRLPLTRGLPERLALKVYPDDLRSDFPVAELRAVVEDAFGDRVDAKGLSVVALAGELSVRRGNGGLRGDYHGDAAVAQGADRIVATYQRPGGPGPVTSVQVGFGPVPGPQGGPWIVHARALNTLLEPVAYVPLRIEVDGIRRSIMTQADGWASTTLDAPATFEPRVLSADAGAVSRRALAIPGEPAVGGPDQADLRAEQPITIRPGRIAAITVTVEPKILRAGPGSMANILVRLEDRSGRPVTDEPVGLEATEGRILPVIARPDGTMVAQYVPEPGTEERTVAITATTEGFRSSTEISIEPRVARTSIGPFIGLQTNFGELQGGLFGLDFDIRTRSRVTRDALVVRLGVHGSYSRTQTALTNISEVDLRATLTALDLAFALRDDRGPVSLWIGGGGTLGILWSAIQLTGFNDTGQDLVGGPMALGGLSRRTPLGEWLIEARGYLIPAPSASDIGYTGNLGGVGIGLGYRLVY